MKVDETNQKQIVNSPRPSFRAGPKIKIMWAAGRQSGSPSVRRCFRQRRTDFQSRSPPRRIPTMLADGTRAGRTRSVRVYCALCGKLYRFAFALWWRHLVAWPVAQSEQLCPTMAVVVVFGVVAFVLGETNLNNCALEL